MIKIALNAAALFAIVYGLIVAGLVVFQRDLLFPADAAPIDGSVAAIPGLEQVQIETSDGERLNAWVVPPAPGRAVLVFFHGNAGNLALAFRVSRFRQLVADGTGLVAVSYRGYGGSTGSPSEAGLHRDGALQSPSDVARRLLAHVLGDAFGAEAVRDLRDSHGR